MVFKNIETENFLKTNKGGFELLQYYLEDLTIFLEGLPNI
jgi:hypothetical protein